MPASLTAPKILSVSDGVLTGTKKTDVKVIRVTLGFAAAEVLVDAQATYQLLSVPAGTVVLEVKCRVITAFTATLTMTVGDGNDVDGFFQSADIAPTSAETAGKFFSSAIAAGSARKSGIKYLAADTIDVVIGTTDPLAGLMEFYFVIADATGGAT